MRGLRHREVTEFAPGRTDRGWRQNLNPEGLAPEAGSILLPLCARQKGTVRGAWVSLSCSQVGVRLQVCWVTGIRRGNEMSVQEVIMCLK